MFRDLWGTCTLPIPAPHRHIAWRSEGPLLCLLTGRWIAASHIAATPSIAEEHVWPPTVDSRVEGYDEVRHEEAHRWNEPSLSNMASWGTAFAATHDAARDGQRE
jgi:hypothetical protein